MSHRAARLEPIAWTALLAVSLLCLSACVGSESAQIEGNAVFNDLLRADMNAVSEDNEAADNERYFSDGGPSGDEVVSELVPTDVASANLPRLRRSEVFWIFGNGVALSHELVLENPVWNGKRPTRSEAQLQREDSGKTLYAMGWHPELGYTDPITRAFVWYDGNFVSAPHRPEQDGYTVSLETCTDGAAARDPYAPARPLDENCSWEALDVESCDFSYSQFARDKGLPWSTIGCGLTTGDASYRLMAADYFDPDVNVREVIPTVTHEPKQLLPHIRTVPSSPGLRTLARPMKARPPVCWIVPEGSMQPRPCTHFGEDPGNGAKYQTSEWQWWVDERPDGLWSENFSDQLMVTSVRLFVEDTSQTSGRRYLGVDEIDSLEVGRQFCEPRINEVTGNAGFDLMNCPQLLAVTPAYDRANLQGPTVDAILEWRAHFRAAAAGSEFIETLPVKEGDPLYIEFTIASTTIAQSLGGLILSPVPLDFGKVKSGTTNVIERAFTIENVGINAERIEDLWVSGENAADFDVELADGLRLPFNLGPGDTFDVHASFTGRAGTGRYAEMRMRSSLWGVPRDIRVPMRATTTASYGDLAPSYRGVFLEGGGGYGDPNVQPGRGHIFALQMASLGNGALTIHSVDVVGPDAHLFTVLERSPGLSHYEHQFYGFPYRTPQGMAPGQFQDLIVVYHPDGPGVHRATVQMVDDSGTQETDILAECSAIQPGDCEYWRPQMAP